MSNPLRHRLDAGQKGTNCWLTLPGGHSTEFIASAGFDAVTIDMQHGLLGLEAALTMIQVSSLCGVTPMVRLAANDGSHIAALLDAGAMGLICPMINSVDQCEAFVRAALYPPSGTRSFGPNRVRLAEGAADYFEGANGRAMLFAMIETEEALGNLASILSVQELYGVYIGPADLSLSLGHNPVKDQGIPAMLDIYARITGAAHERGLKVGFQCSSVAQIERMSGTDIDFLTLLSDNRMLTLASEQALKAASPH